MDFFLIMGISGYATSLFSVILGLFPNGIAYAIGDVIMKSEHIVSIQQMKDALRKEADSKFPLKITRKDGESIVRYIRGFADQQTNILLISETPYSLALRILEIKDIHFVEYPGSVKALVLQEHGVSNILKKMLNFDAFKAIRESIHNSYNKSHSLLKRVINPAYVNAHK